MATESIPLNREMAAILAIAEIRMRPDYIDDEYFFQKEVDVLYRYFPMLQAPADSLPPEILEQVREITFRVREGVERLVGNRPLN